MPWTVSGIPTNLISKKAYRGINLFLLASLGYEHSYIVSYKKAQELGATIKQHEKGHLVVFWKWLEDESDEQKEPIPT